MQRAREREIPDSRSGSARRDAPRLARTVGGMNATPQIATELSTKPRDVAALLGEIERYLAAVETFRREGCEPRWAPEPGQP